MVYISLEVYSEWNPVTPISEIFPIGEALIDERLSLETIFRFICMYMYIIFVTYITSCVWILGEGPGDSVL